MKAEAMGRGQERGGWKSQGWNPDQYGGIFTHSQRKTQNPPWKGWEGSGSREGVCDHTFGDLMGPPCVECISHVQPLNHGQHERPGQVHRNNGASPGRDSALTTKPMMPKNSPNVQNV